MKKISLIFVVIATVFITSCGDCEKKISKADEIQSTLEQAFKQKGPAVVEIMVNRDPKYTGSPAWGWWDVPIPAYMKEKRAKYLEQIKEEDLS